MRSEPVTRTVHFRFPTLADLRDRGLANRDIIAGVLREMDEQAGLSERAGERYWPRTLALWQREVLAIDEDLRQFGAALSLASTDRWLEHGSTMARIRLEMRHYELETNDIGESCALSRWSKGLFEVAVTIALITQAVSGAQLPS